MGTNYYALRKLSDLDKQAVKDAVDAEDWLEVKRLMPSVVHIGKSSAGWQFLFNHDDWQYFEANLDSLKAFLQGSRIENEYGDNITHEAFWEMVDNKKGHKGDAYYHRYFGLCFSSHTDFS